MLCLAVDSSNALSVVTPTPADVSTCQYVLLTPDEAGFVGQSFDPVVAGQMFAFGFSSVVFMWFVGKACRGVLGPKSLDIAP